MTCYTVFDPRILQAAREAVDRLPVEISMKPLSESYRMSVARKASTSITERSGLNHK